MTRRENFLLILLLGSLSTISPFSIDMYLPGFPTIAKDLGTTIDRVQFSLTGYLVGIAVGQLLYGPLLDRYGRTKPLYVGLAAYIAASVACAFSPSIDSLIAMRFVQALGGCAGMVASQTLVRDLFPTNKTAQAFSSLSLVIAVSPMIAPTLGGYVTAAFGWQSIFYMLAFITFLIAVCVYLFLPEGRGPDPTISLRPRHVIKDFFGVVKEPQFVMYAIGGGIANAATFAYISGSSFVFIELYGVTPQQYGWIFASVAAGLIGCAQLNHILLNKFTSQQLVKYILRFQTLVGLIFALGVWLDWFNLAGFLAMTFIFVAGQGITGPNSSALSLAPFSRNTGSAASLLGCFRMAAAGLTSAGVSALHNGTAIPMVVGMAIGPLLAVLLLALGKGIVRHRANKKQVEEDAGPLM
jgi:DHA1 family bicyclomycin/chloramphenicol resistance-like MFS transporter